VLKQLHIRNLAIIDELTLDFGTGFSVLTGETGAGKSILIDALGLVIGTRADSALVRAGQDKAEIGAEFSLADAPAAAAWLREQDLLDADDPGHCLIRRVVYAEGRTRAFVNDSPVSAAALRELGETLIEVFGQNESHTLLRSEQQRTLLDAYGRYDAALAAVANATVQWQDVRAAIERARSAGSRDPAQLDYLRFQLGELEAMNLQEGEIAELETGHRRLANAGRLLQEGNLAQELLYGGENSAYDQLSQVATTLANLSAIDAGFGAAEELVAAAQAQASEAAAMLKHLLDRLDLDPAQLAEMEARLSSLHDLARKHRVRLDELPARLAALRAELAEAEEAGGLLAKLEAESETAYKNWRGAADKLGAERRKAAKKFGDEVTRRVRTLGMDSAQLLAVVEPAGSERPRAHAAGGKGGIRLRYLDGDQLAGAELVADLLHGGQQHVVQGRDRADLVDRLVDPVLHAVLLAAQDVEVQRLLGLHALGGVGAGAEGRPALEAVAARPAADVERDGDPVPHPHPIDGIAHFGHLTQVLVPEHTALRKVGPALVHVQVGAADVGARDPHHHVGRLLDLRIRHVPYGHVARSVVDDCSHDNLLRLIALIGFNQFCRRPKRTDSTWASRPPRPCPLDTPELRREAQAVLGLEPAHVLDA